MDRHLTRIASCIMLLTLFFCGTASFDIEDLLQRSELKRVKRTASCSIDNGGCDINCEETPSGAQCSCPMGFIARQDGRSCEDINECETDNGDCQYNCHNNHGGFRCSCPPGFMLNRDERTCRDIDECASNDSCAHTCTNTIGSYECRCHDGYVEYVTGRCGDINECVENNGGCAHNCLNTDGSYKCSCRTDHVLHWNMKDCIKIDKSSFVSQLRNGQVMFHSNQKRVWFECYGRHTFKFHQKTPSSFQYSCGDGTDETGLKGASYPWITRYLPNNYTSTRGDLAMVIKKKFNVNVKDCSLSGMSQLQTTSRGIDKFDILSVNISCGKPLKRKKRRYVVQVIIKALVPLTRRGRADSEVQRNKPIPTTKRRVSKLLKSIRKSVKGTHQFNIRFPNVDVTLVKRGSSSSSHIPSVFDTGRGNYETCQEGSVLDLVSGSCVNCTTGYYQDGIGKVQCIECPSFSGQIGNDIPIEDSSKSIYSCSGVCKAGYYSDTGSEPCLPCPENTYQPYQARLACYACGTRNTNSRLASTSFGYCSVRGTCTAGHYYDVVISSCKRCPKGFYQNELGQNFCYQCPPGTTTDTDASTRVDACKRQECIKILSNIQGYIESPNYPGEYPINTQCTWTITPPRNRKLLLVIPEIHLRSEDRCGDSLSIFRKPGSRNSRPGRIVTEYESCQISIIPQTVTPRAKKLIIEFKSDGRNTAKGFRIPYVTYDESYESIITDIVSDSRLFSESYHQDILKDKTSRETLLDVLANPQNYFALRKDNFHGLFREAFISFLRGKVLTFLNPPTS